MAHLTHIFSYLTTYEISFNFSSQRRLIFDIKNFKSKIQDSSLELKDKAETLLRVTDIMNSP